MTRNSRTGRIGLLLAYAVMTVWVQAGHRHGHEAEAETQCRDGCRDPRPHYSGHASVDLGRAPSDCPACQLRSNLYVSTPTVPALGGEIVANLPRPEPIRLVAATADRPSCRGPPRA